jgi:tetratricopeptide (TPR) repeat protein
VVTTVSINALLRIPFNAVMLYVASTLMLLFPVAVDILVFLAWLTLGILENAWSVVNFWLILLCLVFSFVQYLISSYLFGRAKLAAGTIMPDAEHMGLRDKLSETIDLGWDTSLRVGLGCIAVTLIVVTTTFLIFFNDIVFVVGLFRGIETGQDKAYRASIQWFKKCVHVAGSDRIALSRFLLAGSFVHDDNFADAIPQLKTALVEENQRPRPNPSILLFLNSALCDAQEHERDWQGAAKSSEDNLRLLGTTKVFPEIEVRLIGDLKYYFDPDGPTVLSTLHALENIYLKAGKFDKAQEVYGQILAQYSDNKLSTRQQLFREMQFFQYEAGASDVGKKMFVDKIVEATFIHAQKIAPSTTTDRKQFFADYQQSVLSNPAQQTTEKK